MRETDPNLGSVGFDRTGLSHSVDSSQTESIHFSHVCGSNQIREFVKLPLSTLLFQKRVRNMEMTRKNILQSKFNRIYKLQNCTHSWT